MVELINQFFYIVIIGFMVLTSIFLSIVFLKKYLRKRSYLNSHLSKIDKFSGEQFEDYLYYIYKDMGYKVKKTASTGDYGVDLILYNQDEKIALQAKRYKKRVGVSAVQQVVAGMSYYDCDRSIVVTNSFFTAPAINLADKNNVELIDRNHIDSYIRRLGRYKA